MERVLYQNQRLRVCRNDEVKYMNLCAQSRVYFSHLRSDHSVEEVLPIYTLPVLYSF